MDLVANSPGVLQIIIGLIALLLGLILGRIIFFKQEKILAQQFSEEKKLFVSQSEKYRNQTEMYDLILQNIQEGVIAADTSDLVVWSNRRALEILKTSWATAGGKNINQILPPNKQSANPNEYQVKLTTLNEDLIIVNVKSYPLISSNSQIQRTIYIIQDVTEKISLEEMKLDFVAIAAHQLRTPLTAIKGYLNLLQESGSNKLSSEEQTYLKRSLISTDRLAALIENLLDISRVERGALKINFKDVDIVNVIKTTIDLLSPNAKEKNVQLILGQLKLPYPVILGDPNLLGEAISNVIANGIKYNHEGGQVLVDMDKQEGGVTINVVDTGKGITPSMIPHLFEKFYQGTNSLSELSNGMGLGLYIAKSIIDAHKGKIIINSIEGKGTTVSIFLPAKSQGVPTSQIINSQMTSENFS